MSDVLQYFSRHAQAYDRTSSVQAEIASALCSQALPTRLDHIEPGTGRILDLGSGTGLLTSLLRARFPHDSLIAADGSESMMRSAQGRVDKVQWIVADMNSADFEHVLGSRPYHLIASNCALHWADSLDGVLASCRRLLAPAGHLVGAVMTAGTLSALHEVRRLVAPNKPPLRQLPDAHRVESSLRQAGLAVECFHRMEVEQSYDSMSSLLTHLRSSAFTGGKFAHGASMLNRSELTALCSAYRDRCLATQDRVWAKFECVLFRAGQGEPKDWESSAETKTRSC